MSKLRRLGFARLFELDFSMQPLVRQQLLKCLILRDRPTKGFCLPSYLVLILYGPEASAVSLCLDPLQQSL
jgi:hypothetical protein